MENCQRNLFTHGFAGQLGSSNPSLRPFHIVPLCGLVLASSLIARQVGSKGLKRHTAYHGLTPESPDHALDAFIQHGGHRVLSQGEVKQVLPAYGTW